ncbi:hypothetical protein L210DRAFT_3542024, partial [Boletus edulis BED1]
MVHQASDETARLQVIGRDEKPQNVAPSSLLATSCTDTFPRFSLPSVTTYV